MHLRELCKGYQNPPRAVCCREQGETVQAAQEAMCRHAMGESQVKQPFVGLNWAA